MRDDYVDEDNDDDYYGDVLSSWSLTNRPPLRQELDAHGDNWPAAW